MTPEQALRFAEHEFAEALKADSIDHMLMHLRTAAIMLRGIDDPDYVRQNWSFRIDRGDA